MTMVVEGRRAVIAFLAKSSLLGFGSASLGGCEIFWEAIRKRPIRRDLATLGAGDATVDTYPRSGGHHEGAALNGPAQLVQAG